MKYALGNMLNGAGSINPDGLALDLQFAADKAYAADGTVVSGTGQFNITSRKGPPAKFTRGSGATRVNDLGLIEWAPENLLLQSENFATTWTNDVGNVTITTDVATSPDGTTSADKIAESASTISRRICIQNISVTSGTTYSYSCYIKAGERDFAQLATGSGLNNAFQNFILNGVGAGTLGSSNNIVSSRIDAAPNGWYRCTIVVLGTATGSTTVTVGPAPSSTLGRWNSYTSIAGSGILVWGAQLERHTSARAYIPTTTAAAYTPRFDHDPVTLASRGLLIEEQRQNLLSFSEAINNTAWNTFAAATAVDNQTTSPSGVASSASRLTANAGTDTQRTRVRITNITTGGSTYSASAFVKAGASNFGVVYMSFNKSGIGVIRNCDAHIVFSTGVVTQTGVSNSNFTVTSTPYPDGWYRITISATSNASTAVEDQVVLGVGISFNGTGGSGTFVGTETVFAWGAQLEAGSFPTSYIPTTTSALTRSADVCSITGAAFSGFYNQPEGTLFSQTLKASTNNNAFIAHISDNSFSNGIDLRYNNVSQVVSLMNVSNVNQLTGMATNITSGSVVKQAFGYKLNDCAYSVNGGSPVLDATASIPTVTQMNIGTAFSGFVLNGTIAAIRYYKKRLPNAKLQFLTA